MPGPTREEKRDWILSKKNEDSRIIRKELVGFPAESQFETAFWYDATLRKENPYPPVFFDVGSGRGGGDGVGFNCFRGDNNDDDGRYNFGWGLGNAHDDDREIRNLVIFNAIQDPNHPDKRPQHEYNFFFMGYQYLISSGFFDKNELRKVRDAFTEAANQRPKGILTPQDFQNFFRTTGYIKAISLFLYLIVKYSYPNISTYDTRRAQLKDIVKYANLIVNNRNEETAKFPNPNQGHAYVTSK